MTNDKRRKLHNIIMFSNATILCIEERISTSSPLKSFGMKGFKKSYLLGIKLLFLSFTGYLIYQEFYVFLIEKPTYTSSSKFTISMNETFRSRSKQRLILSL